MLSALQTKQDSKYQEGVLMLLNASMQDEPIIPLVLAVLYKLQLKKVL